MAKNPLHWFDGLDSIFLLLIGLFMGVIQSTKFSPAELLVISDILKVSIVLYLAVSIARIYIEYREEKDKKQEQNHVGS